MAESPPVALEVIGQVMIEMDGGSARIEARGDRIIVLIPSLRAGVVSLRPFGSVSGRREKFHRLSDALMAAGLTLEVMIGDSSVALLGLGARSGLASRILGLAPLEISLSGILGSFWRRSNRPE